MSKKLAIQGHATRGKEVIELLEMLGGINDRNYIGTNTWKDEYYTLDNGYIRVYDWSDDIKFTLEEFLVKYPFKVGDKVVDYYGNSITIKSMEWSEDCETMVYDFKDSVIVLAAEDLLKYNAEFLVNKEKSEEVGKMLCDTTLNHLHRISLKNVLSELYEHIKSTSKEELEREFKEIESEGWTNVGPTVEEFMDFCNKVNKKPIYPKTYEECCEKLGIEEDLWFVYEDIDANHINPACISNYRMRRLDLYHNLEKLLICRDAYWKIYGEQMGLDKSWKPEFGKCVLFDIKFYLYQDDFVLHKGEYNCSDNCILVFPTAEMRDAFYNNFKNLINQCKELL